MRKEDIPSWRFYNDEKYPFNLASLHFKQLLKVFVFIADSIGMPKNRAIDECYDFCKGKSNSNSLITIMLFGSVNLYKKFLKKNDQSIKEDIYLKIYPFLNIMA